MRKIYGSINPKPIGTHFLNLVGKTETPMAPQFMCLLLCNIVPVGLGKKRDFLRFVYKLVRNRVSLRFRRIGMRNACWVYIFINDLFSFIQETEICNFADDNTFHANGFFLHAVISALKKGSENALKWLKINYMAANPAKFQIMFLGMPEEREMIIDISGVALKSSPADKLLGVFLDRKLNFKTHIQSLCKTASQKIKDLFRIRPYLNFRCAKHLCEGYILSTFNYCPLIWMFSSKANDSLINIYTSWDQTCSSYFAIPTKRAYYPNRRERLLSVACQKRETSRT